MILLSRGSVLVSGRDKQLIEYDGTLSKVISKMKLESVAYHVVELTQLVLA